MFDKGDRLVLATPADVLAHRTAAEVFSADGPLDRLLREAFRTRQSLPWRVVELSGDTETPRVAVTVQFVEEQGERVGSLVTFRDASTRAQLKDQLDMTAKLAALGRLTSGVAHEVKNPLNAMVLQLEILKTKLEGQTDRVQPQLEILSAEIRRLDRVVKTFLDFTRPVELHPTETDLGGLIGEVFTLAEPQAWQNNVRLVLEPNGALPRVSLDRDLMKQALLNLVLNGCQAMPSGGQLKVTPQASSHRVELEIAEQGVGIPPEIRPRIFSSTLQPSPAAPAWGWPWLSGLSNFTADRSISRVKLTVGPRSASPCPGRRKVGGSQAEELEGGFMPSCGPRLDSLCSLWCQAYLATW